MDAERTAREWQIGVWDRMAPLYLREIDRRFAPVVEGVITRAGLQPGQQVLDVGTGTGAVALQAASLVAPTGSVIGIDISADMLALARRRADDARAGNVDLREGRAESLPVADGACDVVLASLSLMYALDRATAAREIARVLHPGGRFVAAAWAGPHECDIVLFQQTAGSFAPPPPAASVGPGALANPAPFLAQLTSAGIDAQVETETLSFDVPNFQLAWDVLAGVTAAQLSPERREEAKTAVRAVMWPDGDGPRHFRNKTHFIVGVRQ